MVLSCMSQAFSVISHAVGESLSILEHLLLLSKSGAS